MLQKIHARNTKNPPAVGRISCLAELGLRPIHAEPLQVSMVSRRRWKLTRPMRTMFLLMIFSQVLFLTVAGQGVGADYTDNFNSYTDGQDLDSFAGELNWVKASRGPVEKTTVTISGVAHEVVKAVQPTYDGSWASVKAHAGEPYVRVQADFIKLGTSWHNVQHAGVFLNAQNVPDVSSHGGKNMYRGAIVNSNTGIHMSLTAAPGNKLPGFKSDTWYELLLEAHYKAAYDETTVTFTVTEIGGPVLGRLAHTYDGTIDTPGPNGPALSGGFAGMAINSTDASMLLDNFEMEYASGPAIMAKPVTMTLANELVLVSDGKARITITHEYEPAAFAGAKRLRDYLERMTGVSLPIAHLSQVPEGSPRILLGYQAAQTVGIDIVQSYPGDQRVVVKRVGNDLVIAGNDARLGPHPAYKGTRYAIDMFLAELGTEFYGPDPNWHVVAQHNQLAVGNINIDTSPAFEARSTFFFQHPHGGSHPDFDGPSWGNGGTRFHLDHNYYQMYPASQFFASNPEWYALVNGVRQTSQICLSNAEVQARAIDLARAHFDNDSSQVMFSLTANDGLGFCECVPCSQLGNNISGQNLAFANIVAAGLRQTHPDKDVAFLAYLGTHTPPQGVQADPGVEVWLVDQTCPVHSVDDPSCQAGAAGKAGWKVWLDGWQATGVDLSGIYEYYLPSFGGWVNVPYVPGDAALRDLRFYRDEGIRYMYYQGDQSEVPADAPIRWPLAYVASKGMWNPDLTAEQILRPATQRLFGNASEPMLSFYLECATALEDSPYHGPGWWGMLSAQNVYTAPVVKTIRRLLDKAKQMAAAESPEVIRRVNDVIECWGRTEQIINPAGTPAAP